MSIHLKNNNFLKESKEAYAGYSGKTCEVKAIYGHADGNVRLLYKAHPTEPYIVSKSLYNSSLNVVNIKSYDEQTRSVIFAYLGKDGVVYSGGNISGYNLPLHIGIINEKKVKTNYTNTFRFTKKLGTLSDRPGDGCCVDGKLYVCTGSDWKYSANLIVFDVGTKVFSSTESAFNIADTAGDVGWLNCRAAADSSGKIYFKGGNPTNANTASHRTAVLSNGVVSYIQNTGDNFSSGAIRDANGAVMFCGGYTRAYIGSAWNTYPSKHIAKFSNGVYTAHSLSHARGNSRTVLDKNGAVWVCGGYNHPEDYLGTYEDADEAFVDVDVISPTGVLTSSGVADTPEGICDIAMDGTGNIHCITIAGEIVFYKYVDGAYIKSDEAKAYRESANSATHSNNIYCQADAEGDIVIGGIGVYVSPYLED